MGVNPSPGLLKGDISENALFQVCGDSYESDKIRHLKMANFIGYFAPLCKQYLELLAIKMKDLLPLGLL